MTRILRIEAVGILAVAALMVCWSTSARAHDGHESEDPHAPRPARSLRTWTHASGRYQVYGSFVATHGDQVQVRRQDGGLLDIKLGALSGPDRAWVEGRVATIRRINGGGDEAGLLAQRPGVPAGGVVQGPPPSILASFQPFEDTLRFRWDDRYVFVESNGMPDHRMMVGITAWQQQVPLPQAYTGANAWRIPLHPVPARRPMSARENFFRGAIALAVNGVPIFNPIKNDGRTDTYLAGELDEFGGHCGRADDYHYHIAPIHLEPRTGKGQPLAYALDGYPIYGYDEPDGSKPRRLDAFNGHEVEPKSYHYHATKAYPYLNGGFHGEVTERGGQVDPQPRAEPVREALPPLRGARIVAFDSPGPGRYRLTYELRGKKNVVDYTLTPNGPVTFQFIDSAGKTTTRTSERRGRGPGPGGDRGRARPPGAEDGPPPRDSERRAPPPQEPGRRPRPPLITALDKDQDGQLSAAEIAGASASIATLDRDRDGTVSNDELRPPRPPGDAGRPQPKASRDDRPPPPGGRRPPPPEMTALDSNADGALSADEVAQARSSLLTLDRDKDGRLSDEELRPEAPRDQPPPDESRLRPPAGDEADRASVPGDFGSLVVTSPAFPPGGMYPVDFTCDGSGASPPIQWTGVPEGTRSFALNVWHVPAPGGVKSYWVLYNIPADVNSLPRNAQGIGIRGLNDKRRTDYDPMCSQGPGRKTYHITVYALSKELTLAPGQATRAELLHAIADVKLAQKTLTYQYERSGRP